MTPRWYEREVERPEEELANGELAIKEFNEAMRYLNAELQAAAEEAAQQAYDDVMGNW